MIDKRQPPAAALICLALLSGVAVAREPADPNAGWEEILARNTNAIWVVRETGDLFASRGREVYFTRDAGVTWNSAPEAQNRGRHWNSISFDGDWQGQRLALFPVDSPIGWMTLDGGRTWTTFAKPAKPQVNKHDGWTFGVVDWSEKDPRRMVGKEHHSGRYWLSSDAGKSWTQLDGFSGYFGLGMGADGALLLGTMESKKHKLPGSPQGIYRSEDDGRSWQCVFECEMSPKVRAHRFDRDVYWPTTQGIAHSADGGKNWKLMPDSPADGRFGPLFGKTGQDMIVVNADGVFRTADGGKSWSLIVPRAKMPKVVRDADFGDLKPCFAWDPQNDILYATSMGVPLYKLQLAD